MTDTPSSAQFEGNEALVIVNPVAHNLPSRKRRAEADEWLHEQGWRVQWVETTGRGDATSIAARAAERGVPLVFVCGGDGTLSEAAHGLAGSDATLSIIPAGTVNLWAREVGLHRKPLDAVQLAVRGVRRHVDLGLAGDRHFLLMAGFGIDASVTSRVSPRVKGRLGAASYALAAAREALTYRTTWVRLRIDDEVIEGDVFMVLAGNTQNYAGITKVALLAHVDDGLLDVCVYRGRGKADMAAHAALTLLRLHRHSRKVIYRRARRIEFEWSDPLPLQIDGDPTSDSPSMVTVVPAALWVAVPRDLKSPLFSDSPGPQREGVLNQPGR